MIGFAYEGIGIYVMYKELNIYENKLSQVGSKMTSIDCLVFLCVNILVGVLSIRKDDNFF